jgi:hypothetical protein
LLTSLIPTHDQRITIEDGAKYTIQRITIEDGAKYTIQRITIEDGGIYDSTYYVLRITIAIEPPRFVIYE